MLRFLYQSVLRLHPPTFRARFGEEMLGIFDQAEGTVSVVRLLGDGLVSLLRQWVLRSEFWGRAQADAPVLSGGNGVPAFYTFATFKPRSGALVYGAALSLAIFCAVCFIVKYGVNQAVYMPFAAVVAEQIPQNPRSSASSKPPAGKSAVSMPPQIQFRPQVFKLGQNRTNSKLRHLLMNFGQPPRRDRALPLTAVHGQPAATRIPQGAPAENTPTASPVSQRAPAVVVPVRVLMSYVGIYGIESPEPLTVSVTMDAGQLDLEVSGEPKSPLISLSETRFMAAEATDLWVEFSPPKGGTSQRMRIHCGDYQLLAHRR